MASSFSLRWQGLLQGLALCSDSEDGRALPPLPGTDCWGCTLGACAGAVPVTISVVLNSKQKSPLGFWWCWTTLKESPLNASPVLGGATCRGAVWGRRGSAQPWALWDPPGKKVFPGSIANRGHPCFTCHNGWQSWGAADGLLLFDLVKLCVLQGSLTSLNQPPPRETRNQQGTCLQRYLLWCIWPVSHTLLVGSPVSNLCHVYHHPKSLGRFFSLLHRSSPCFKHGSAHTASSSAGGPGLVFWPRRNKWSLTHLWRRHPRPLLRSPLFLSNINTLNWPLLFSLRPPVFKAIRQSNIPPAACANTLPCSQKEGFS